jgi:serine/threonine protein kinase
LPASPCWPGSRQVRGESAARRACRQADLPDSRSARDGRGDDVFLAHHEIFNGKSVPKTVRMHGLEDALASNEPAFLNQLDHPHIVLVREAQWDPEGDRAITFVMPLLEGGSVEDALKQDYRFSIAQAITIAVHALDALAYLRRESRRCIAIRTRATCYSTSTAWSRP